MLKHRSIKNPNVPNSNRQTLGQASRWGVGEGVLRFLIVAFTFLLILQPGSPLQGDLLDSSWARVLAYGLLQGKHWGSELAFTYGPLGFITPYLDYVPEIFPKYLAAQAIFGILYASTCWFALSGSKPPQWLCLGVTLLFFGRYLPGDVAWLTSTGLSLIAVRQLLQNSNAGLAQTLGLVLVSLLPPLLPLVKASLLPLWLTWLLAGVIMMRGKGRYDLALLHLLLATGIPLAAWVLCNQSITDIPPYLRNSVLMARGYAMAMGAPPPLNIIDITGLATLAMSLTALALQYWLGPRRAPDIALSLALTICIVVSFKAAYTRADFLHTPIFPVTAIIILSTLPYSRYLASGMWGKWVVAPILAPNLMAWTAILVVTPGLNPMAAAVETKRQVSKAIQVLLDQRQLEQALEERKARFDRILDLPRISSTVGGSDVDVFSHEQVAAYANHLALSPRPVFQSYSTYDFSLAKLNDDFYASNKAPRWIVFKLQTIDDRLPLEDDALAVPRILSNYEPVMTERGYLLLARSGEKICATPAYGLVDKLQLGQTMTIPANGASAWWLRAKVQPSALGYLKSLILRTSALQIEVTTTDGLVHRYRLLPEVAASGFIISPALRDNDDLQAWQQGSVDRRVKAIRIIPGIGANARDFSSSIDISIAEDRCHLARHAAQPSDGVPKT